MSKEKNKRQILEGSRAIALTIKNIAPQVVSAYPITPQTHIVEDLAKIKAEGEADFEYIRAESEFAAASIVLGASASGSRVYSASSSQGLLLMTEVLYSISGLRLPVVMTIANRAISSPINIWNDHQDAMAVRDTAWIMFFAENNQEAIEQHILAYKVAEKTKLPVFVNVDGFILSHCYEAVSIPDKKTIEKFLPPYQPPLGSYLNPKQAVTMGALVDAKNYQKMREKLFIDFKNSLKIINQEFFKLQKTLYPNSKKDASKNNTFFEYTGSGKEKNIIIALGSVIGTIKEALKDREDWGILKIKTFRPFSSDEVYDIIKKAKQIAVLEKSINPGHYSPLCLDIKSLSLGQQNIKNFITGLGGKDISQKKIKAIVDNFKKYSKINFI